MPWTVKYCSKRVVQGYSGEAGVFIATQGPMTNTVIDFWQMVWQQRSPAVVMITKLTEHNRVTVVCLSACWS